MIKKRLADASIAVTVTAWAALFVGFALIPFGVGSWQAITVEALVCAAASTLGLVIRDGVKYRSAYELGRRDTVEAFARRRVVPLDRR